MQKYSVGYFFFYAIVTFGLLWNDTSTNMILSIRRFWTLSIELASSKAPSLTYFSTQQKFSAIESAERTQMRRVGEYTTRIERNFSGICLVTLLALVFLYVSKCIWRMRNRVGGNPALGFHWATVASTTFSSKVHLGNTAVEGAGRAEVPVSGYLKRHTGLPFLSRAWKYVMRYRVFFPYMWPSGSRYLQFMAVVCLCLTGCQRAVNALLPYQIAVVTETLSTSSEPPWFHISKYFIYKWLQGGSGLLNSLQSTLWSEVSENSSMELSIAAFEHVHSLDLDFHLGKRNSDILSVLRNGSSVTRLMELVIFRVLPAVCDLIIAIRSLWLFFDPYSALLLLFLVLSYLQLMTFLAPRKTKFQRQMIEASMEENAVM